MVAFTAIGGGNSLAVLSGHDNVIVVRVKQLSSLVVAKAGTATITAIADVADVCTEIATIWFDEVVVLHFGQSRQTNFKGSLIPAYIVAKEHSST